MKYLLLVIICIFIISCNKKDDPINPINNDIETKTCLISKVYFTNLPNPLFEYSYDSEDRMYKIFSGGDAGFCEHIYNFIETDTIPYLIEYNDSNQYTDTYYSIDFNNDMVITKFNFNIISNEYTVSEKFYLSFNTNNQLTHQKRYFYESNGDSSLVESEIYFYSDYSMNYDSVINLISNYSDSYKYDNNHNIYWNLFIHIESSVIIIPTDNNIIERIHRSYNTNETFTYNYEYNYNEYNYPIEMINVNNGNTLYTYEYYIIEK